MKTLLDFQLFDRRALFRGTRGNKTDGGSSTIFSAVNNYPVRSIKTHKWGPKKRATRHHHHPNFPNWKTSFPLYTSRNAQHNVLHVQRRFIVIWNIPVLLIGCALTPLQSKSPPVRRTKQPAESFRIGSNQANWVITGWLISRCIRCTKPLPCLAFSK